jgi:hypothetical protein
VQTTGAESVARGLSLVGILGVLMGICIVVLLVFDTLTPSVSGSNALSSYNGNVNLYWADLLTTVVLAGVGIPFIAGLGRILSPRSSTLASGASLLVVGGLIGLLVAQTVTTMGLWAVTQGPTTGVYATSATVQASFAYELGNEAIGVGFFLLGAGIILLGWVGWGSALFPKWLSLLSVIGGVSGLLAPAMLGPLASASLLLSVTTAGVFVILGVTTGLLILRPRTAGAGGTPESVSPAS